MNVILYLTIFIIGAILGTLTTLIVKTTLKEKVTRKRPYIVNSILSGIIFILFSISIKLNIKTINTDMLINFMFATFYIATLFVIAKIDKKEHRIDKKMILLGFLLMAIYMIYTYIADKNKTVYGYMIYLFIICILIIADTIYMKRKAKQSYTLNILMVSMIMILFTYEGVVFFTVNYTLLIIGFKLLISKIANKKTRYVKTDKKTQLQIPIAYYMCIANIIMLLITNYYIFYYM